MSELNFSHFQEYFEALWSNPEKPLRTPFAWQTALTKRVIENTEQPWPESIQLPTASGKTACIDIAVFALAMQADRIDQGLVLNAPRRIFFVVDRRVIVDEAYERARAVARKLKDADSGILKLVADRLRKLANSDTPLAVFQLRGGMYRSNAWANSPIQPTIIASTVDQLGSRLLFRAYGPGSGTWPIHAGLTGNDALILLDEAHCAQPFLETLIAVKKYRQWGEANILPPFHVSVMSATPPNGMTDIFKDESAEPKTKGHPLGDRQLASKRAELVEPVANTKGDNYVEGMAAELAKKAEALAESSNLQINGQPAVVIFCNRVAIAREVSRLLTHKHGNAVILLTGRMRPIDKDETVNSRLKKLSAENSHDRSLEQALFVVATQTLEVGANLDFDILVTECASLDALRQRFGRLNRMGRPFDALAAILISIDQAKAGYEDPVYGTALTETWQWLKQQSNLDMGIAALSAHLPEQEELEKLNAPSPHAPVMLPAHVDCWAQTSPIPQSTPDVGIFLHGPGNRSADVQVCWRADVEIDSTQENWKEILSLVPPSSAECLAVPIYLMRRWLTGDDADIAEQSDLEGENILIDNKGHNAINRRVIRWNGSNESEIFNSPETLRPGDVLVIPATINGWKTLGDFTLQGNGLPVLDWGDRANAQVRAKAVLRLHPDVITSWPHCESFELLHELIQQAQQRYEDDNDDLCDELLRILGEIANEAATPDWLRGVIKHLSIKKNRASVMLHPVKGLIVFSKLPMPRKEEQEAPDLFSDETDLSASGTSRKQNLDTHQNGVAKWVRKFGIGCGLPPPIVDNLELSASGHDLGKVDPRFQAWLRGGIPFGFGESLAKSPEMPQSRRESEKARNRAGYPKGGRHELLSVRLLENCSELLPKDDLLRDLVLHLVESHHGYCRPFAPVVFDEIPPSVAIDWRNYRLTYQGPTKLERLDSGVAERFWRLTRYFGWWGLAWLEAILRLADHRRSEWEELHQGENEDD